MHRYILGLIIGLAETIRRMDRQATHGKLSTSLDFFREPKDLRRHF
jgi:hypothetical protein